MITLTPKEKANQLVEKYFDLNWDWDGVTKYDWAKEGALIAVNEIIEELLECGEVWMKRRILYWQEVKQEIESYE